MGNSYSLPLPSRKRTSDASSDRPHSQLIETPFKRPRTHKFTQTEIPESSKAAAQMWDTDDCRYSEKSKEYLSQQLFLSHSGKQKNFVEQLYTDLDRENISCFFDKDPQSLPKGVDFPSRIFEAAAKCKVAVVVLTDDFISSKWPMQELCAFVNAKRIGNPGLKILPLFFGISSETFSQMIRNNNFPASWNNLQKSDKRIDLVEWIDALKALRPINGVNYIEGEGEVAYRRQIIGHVRRLLPPSSKYEESHVQGKERLCQEVAKLFDMTPCSKNGVKIAGLYGAGGTGKTTMCRIICNFYCGDFEGRVLHIELQRKSAIKILKHALRIFTDASETLLDSVTSKDHVRKF